jgi:hypothetical protein
MITKFKIFESNYEEDLIEYVDYYLIEKVYDEEYSIDEDELAYICSSCVVDNFNFDRFKEDFIYDMKMDSSYENYDDYDYKEYIKSHLTTEKEEMILSLYNDNNYDEDDEDSEEFTDFDIDYLDDLDNSQLIEVIESDDDLSDFIDYIINQHYGSYSGEEIFDEFYGMSEESIKRANQNAYSFNKPDYETFGHYLWKEYNQYVDDEGMLKSWKDGEDDEYKKEFVRDYIYNYPELQKNILANDKSQVINLFDLFIENSGENIGDTYEFQKAYIEEFEEQDPESLDEDMIIPTAIKNINDNFDLQEEIKKEYKDHLFLIDVDKFNL